jgi:hypothetical protein
VYITICTLSQHIFYFFGNEKIPLLDLTGGVNDVANEIIKSGLIPQKAMRDAIHIAVSSIHNIDVLLTWSCRMRYINHLFLYFLSKTGRDIVSLSMRKYGDALDKFEPNDLNSAFVPTPEFFDMIGTEHISSGIEQVTFNGILPDALEARFSELKRPDSTGFGVSGIDHHR